MLESFFVVLSFAVGRWMGINQTKNRLDITNTKELETKIFNAENKAETWKRRYDNLLFHVNTTSGGKNE